MAKRDPKCRTNMEKEIKKWMKTLFKRHIAKVYMNEEQLLYLVEYMKLHRMGDKRTIGIKKAFVHQNPNYDFDAWQIIVEYEDGTEDHVGMNSKTEHGFITQGCRNVFNEIIRPELLLKLPLYCQGEKVLTGREVPLDKGQLHIHHQAPRMSEIIECWQALVARPKRLDLKGDNGKFNSQVTKESFQAFHNQFARVLYMNDNAHKRVHVKIDENKIL